MRMMNCYKSVSNLKTFIQGFAESLHGAENVKHIKCYTSHTVNTDKRETPDD